MAITTKKPMKYSFLFYYMFISTLILVFYIAFSFSKPIPLSLDLDNSDDANGTTIDQVYCTQDMVICPDGSYAPRDPQNFCKPQCADLTQ